MQFEIQIQNEIYSYEIIMPSLTLRLKKDGELAQKQITIMDYMDWKIRNYIKPLGNSPILSLNIFDDTEYAPYYTGIVDVLESFEEEYKKKVTILPK